MRASEIALLVWAIIASCLCVLITLQAVRIVTHVLSHTEQVRRNGHEHADKLLDRLMAKSFEEYKILEGTPDLEGRYEPPDPEGGEEEIPDLPADSALWMKREFPEMVE